MKKFATIYGIVIGMAVLAVVVAFRYGAPEKSNTNLKISSSTFPTSMTSTTQSGTIISSSQFKNNETIPVQFTCDGERGKSPELQFTGVPENAKSLALITHDPDAPVPGGFTHWVIWNMNPNTTGIKEGSKPESGMEGLPSVAKAMEGESDAGKTGYTGPCPPPGHGVHHYHFRLYALDTLLDLPTSTKKADLEKAMQGHIITETEIIGLYERK